MQGIDLNKPIRYKTASLRFFKEGEHHISRRCPEDVLLLVYDGVLRFSEDGMPYEISAGQYYIQKRELKQTGELPSDVPKYLYVHFLADTWTEGGAVLPRSGTFDHAALKPLMEELHLLAHSDAPYIVQTAKFYDLLSELYKQKPQNSQAARMADFPHVALKGLMAIPPVSEFPGENCRYFAEMRNLFVDIRAKKYDNVSMECLSMGMSDDFADAIAEGSTMVRIGTAIFGKRNYNI